MGANLCPLSIVVSGEWSTGALGRWCVGAKAKMLQLNGFYFPFYGRAKNFCPHVSNLSKIMIELNGSAKIN